MTMTTRGPEPTTNEILSDILLELRRMNTAAARAAEPSGPQTATDYELDGQYGDPEIKKDPPRWAGDSMVGRRYSQTTPEYLDTVAGFKDWSARKDDETGAVDGKGRPKSHWARKDAGLARGWAARLRAGYTPKAGAADASRYGASGYGASAKHSGADYGDDNGDSIPF